MDATTATFAERRRLRSDAIRAVSDALNARPSDEGADVPTYWMPSSDVEISLALETDVGVLRVTRISAEPMGAGWGRVVIDALRAHCAAEDLTLEIPDPFTESMVFWRQFGWEDIGEHGRVVLRYKPRVGR